MRRTNPISYLASGIAVYWLRVQLMSSPKQAMEKARNAVSRQAIAYLKPKAESERHKRRKLKALQRKAASIDKTIKAISR